VYCDKCLQRKHNSVGELFFVKTQILKIRGCDKKVQAQKIFRILKPSIAMRGNDDSRTAAECAIEAALVILSKEHSMSKYDAKLRAKLRKAYSDEARREVALWFTQVMASGTVNEDTLSKFERAYFDAIVRSFSAWKVENGLHLH
jgi:hypothetical protein